MIKNGQNKHVNFGVIKDLFNKCKQTIEKHHIVSIHKQIIMAKHFQQINQIDQSQDMKKLEARVAVMLTIIDNIDENLQLIDKGNTDRHYLEIKNSSIISEIMEDQDQVLIDEADSEAKHGIGLLTYLKLFKEVPINKERFFRRVGKIFSGVAKITAGLVGTALSFGYLKSAAWLMRSGFKDMESALNSRGEMQHEVLTRSSKKSTDLVIADILTAVKRFGKNMNLKSDVAQVMNLE